MVLVTAVFLLLVRGFGLEIPLYFWGQARGLSIWISPLSSFGLHHIRLDGLRVADKSGNVFLSVPKTDIRYNFSKAWRGKILPSISSMEADRPRFTLFRSADGTWSPRLASVQFGFMSAFQGAILFRNGEARITDHFWKPGKNPSHFSLASLEGSADFRNPSRVRLAVRIPGGLLVATGNFQRPRLSGILSVKAQNFPLSDLGNYLLHQKNLRFVSGNLAGGGRVWVSHSGISSVEGLLNLTQGALESGKIRGFNVEGLSCRARVSRSYVRFDRIRGRRGQSAFQGNAIAVFSKSGPLWSGNLYSPGLFLNSIPASNLRLRFSGAGPVVRVDQARWNMNNWKISVRDAFCEKNEGWTDHISAASKYGRFRGSALWAGSANPFVSGAFSGKFGETTFHPVFFGRPGEIYFADKRGFAQVSLPLISGMLDFSRLPFHVQARNVSLKTAAAGRILFHLEPGKGFSGFGSGELSQIEARARFKFPARIPGMAAGKSVWNFGVSRGRGGGSLVSPALAVYGKIKPGGSLFSFAGRSRAGPLDVGAGGSVLTKQGTALVSVSLAAAGRCMSKAAAFSGDFEGSGRNLEFKHFQGILGSGVYDFSGRVFLPRADSFDVQGAALHADAADIERFFPGPVPWLKGASGTISGRLALQKRKRLLGRLRFFVYNGRLWEQPISTAYLDARLESGHFFLNPLIVRSGGDYFFGRGTLGLNGALNLAYEIPGVDLENIAFLKQTGEKLKGRARMQGSLTGTVSDPHVSAVLDVRRLQAGVFHLGKAHAKIFYAGRALAISRARLRNGGGAAGGSARFAWGRERALQADVDFAGIGPADVLAWPALQHLGILDGKVFLSGPVSALNGNFTVRASRDGAQTGIVQGNLDQGTASFSTLKLNVFGGEISGEGVVNPQNSSTAYLEGNRLDLRELAGLLGGPSPLGGTADFKAKLTGSLKNPQMTLRASITRPSYGLVSASSLSGQITYRNGRLTLSGGRIVEPHGEFELSGDLPVFWRSKKIARGPFKLTLQLENQDLKLLSDLVPQVDASGPAGGRFTIAFEPKHFTVDGEAKVNGGTLLLPGMENEIDNLEADLKADQNVLDLKSSGTLGGRLQADGKFSLSGIYGGPVFSGGRIALSGTRLFVQIPQARINVTPDLALSYENGLWKLTGNAALENGAVRADRFTAGFRHELFPGLASVVLNTTVNVGGGVHFIHPHFNVQGSGSLAITGTASSPRMTGELSGTQGTLNFLGHDFSLTQGTASFTRDDRLPYLDVQGVSVRRIQGSLIYIKLTGRPGSLHLDIAADPPLTQNELAMTLSQPQPANRYLGGTNQFMQQEASRWLTTGVESEIFYPVENVFGSAFNLEYFSFELLPTGQLGLEVGKQISPHVAVTYARPVAGVFQQIQADPGSIWGMEYHLSPKIMLRGSHDQRNGFGEQILSQWNF